MKTVKLIARLASYAECLVAIIIGMVVAFAGYIMMYAGYVGLSLV